MIGKHVSCKVRNDDYGRLAKYIADASHKGEKCLMSWCAGCYAGEDYPLGILEAESVQALNTRSSREKTYHLLVSFRPEDESRLTPEAFRAIEERFAVALGFSEHQRHCGIHKNTGNLHLHIAYNMIHPERLTRHEPFRDYKTLSDTCRRLEQEYGLAVDHGMEQAKRDRLREKAAAIEAQTGQESFEGYAKRNREHILKALETARDWQSFHEALKATGISITPHGNGLAIKDPHGHHAVKASAVDRALLMKKLESRFGEYRPYRSLRPVQELSRYQAVPLHRSPERGELYARFRQGIDERKARLKAVKEREDAILAAVRRQWADKRREIESMAIAKKNRRNLLALSRKHEVEATAKARLAPQLEREAIRREIPFTSWNGFLRLEAGKGNETALAVLRSRKETVEPEREPEPQTPVKDWSRHDMEQFAIRAAQTEKERALLKREDIAAKSKKQLQAFIRMEKIAADWKAQGYDLGAIARRVDGKGVVIFTLDSGGSVRDAGKEVFYSVHDDKAREVAMLYAGLKWGRNVALNKGWIIFRQTPELQREQEKDVGWSR
jgi:hypothetical protein